MKCFIQFTWTNLDGSQKEVGNVLNLVQKEGGTQKGVDSLRKGGEFQLKNYAIENAKITKRSRAYEVYASTYNVEILKSFDSELQLKGTESTIKNKLKDLLSELRDFKFVTILVLEFKKIESDDKTQYSFFNWRVA